MLLTFWVNRSYCFSLLIQFLESFLSPICQQYFIDLSLTSLISSSVENYIECFGMLLFVLKWQNTCMVE